MKKVVLFLMLVVFLLFATAIVVGAEEETAVEPAEKEMSFLQDEIFVLRAEIAELRAILSTLQMVRPERQISIGVMPIENTRRIPKIGNAFREILVSSLNEAGINTVESLDRETLNWVLEQDRLVRERLISPVTAPPRGELRGVTHFLFGTVTQYHEKCSNEESGRFFMVRYDGVKVRTGFLSVDFRIVDATTGVIVDAFHVEKKVKERTGPVLFDCSYDSRPISEIACWSVARQAAERIAVLLNPAPEE